MSLAYDKFGILAATLGLNIAELFAEPGAAEPEAVTAVTRSGKGQGHRSGPYLYEILNAGHGSRRMMPVRGRIMARQMEDFDEPACHPGEEFLYVLSGSIDLCIEGEDPLPLAAGDSAYFDSGRRHVYLSTSSQDAEILTVMLPRLAGPDRGTGNGHKPQRHGSAPEDGAKP